MENQNLLPINLQIRVSRLVQSFFISNDISHCIEMSNFLINDAMMHADQVEKKHLEGLVFYHTEVTALLVSLNSALPKKQPVD